MPCVEPNCSPLAIERLTTTAGLANLKDDWQRLMSTGDLDPFNTWEWQAAWWHRLAQGRALWLLVARDGGGEIRGIVPLSLEKTRIGLMPVRRLAFLADELVGSDYLEVIAAPQWRPAVTAAAGRWLRVRGDAWDVIEWRDMDTESDTARQLAAALGPDFIGESLQQWVCPGTALAPAETFDDFLARTQRESNYRRRRRWLERQPGFCIDNCATGSGLVDARREFFRLHDLRWARSGGSAGIPDEPARAFHTEVTDRLAQRGQVRFYTLRVDGQAIASVYALIANDTFYYYQSGMDPAWRRRSAGLVLIGETFADAIRLGLRRYDFLRGPEAYKSDWVDGERRLSRWRFYRRRGGGRRACRLDAGIKAGKQRVKQLLGIKR